MIKAVWFDIGGTVHTQDATPSNDEAYAKRLYDYLTAHGIETTQTPAELLEHINAGAKAYKVRSEEKMAELPGDQIWREFMLKDFSVPASKLDGLGEDLSYMFDRWRKVITRREGLEDTLKQLRDAGYRLGVISNIMSTTFVPRILEEHGVQQYFECILMSSVHGPRKPERGLFDVAKERMGLSEHELAYVGDTISRDVRGVRAAGWEMMIQIENPRVAHKDQKFLDCGYKPDYLIQSLLEIPPIVERFNAR